ncbi:rod shape-determining protein RodA [Mediterraneibacter glycyrrhizinilyticus]|uniref:FtsW/RodA/SpoVE family cell cycle protein n=1 Tax=Mediterraneibacter glycyrrhizinilyticus TaxID=342942 RepID=UPI001961CE32|nr:FtsW/RodA/SpoVE family cell cycle protein [Mediterraneibacter glycyrrhizinilyticus]MBM6750586.1 rod shape-determining protein RodA [Mediterraneibacter glycyrrhizinilyticus]HJC91838.1 rod shape-determining protein RodA [Candidatus Mediterraneibacter excrementigallinarum]
MKFLFKNIKQRYSIRDYRFSLIFLVLTISVIGIFMVGSARPDLMTRQIMGVGLGVIAMLVISLIDYRWILSLYWPIYGLNIIMLATVLLFGETRNNATRWLNLGFVQFQPSDLTKILMILFYAKFLMEREDSIKNPKTIIQGVALILPSLALIYMQPNLSTTLCIAALFCALMYMGGLSYKLIGTILAVIVPAFIILLVIAVQPNQPFLKDYQQERILAWLEPEEYADSASYQQLNSVMAIGSGQLTGKGYNNDEAISVKNGNFVSEPQTDFIFAIIGEELGFVGCCAVIFLLLLIVIDCILIGLKAKDTGGRIICGGVAALIGIQSFINIGVATMVLPNTGLSLPFVSYGLTSVVCFFMGIGFVLNVGLQPNKYQ